MAQPVIKVVGMKAAQKKLDRLKKASPKEAAVAINKFLALIEKKVKINLSGKLLNVGKDHGGRLRRSFGLIKSELANLRKLWGRIGSNIVYAAIHEFGGRAGRGLSVILKARKYFSKAINDASKNFNKILDEMLARIVRA